jgi:hypothetical protein
MHWKNYCDAFNKNPHLSDCDPTKQIIINTAFAARVRTDQYRKKRRVQVQSVQQVLVAAISKTIELAGQPSPIYKAEETYKVPVVQMVEGMQRENPLSIPQITIPISIPTEVLNQAQKQEC